MNICLEPLEDEHLATYLAWRNDPRNVQWTRGGDPISMSEHKRWHERCRDAFNQRSFAIIGNGLLVGVARLSSIELINSRAEFSIIIGPLYEGLGIGREALRQLVEFGFRRFNLNCIYGECLAGNPAINLFDKFGFKRDGVRPQFYFRDGKYIDSIMISILRSDYARTLTSESDRERLHSWTKLSNAVDDEGVIGFDSPGAP